MGLALSGVNSQIKIFISLDSCQFVEYLFKIKIYIFQFLNTKKGDNVSFV